ncbi:hypothetical protein [Clostridium tagluense]|uniref:hypothetical protein n=1 Tax=Clostridium tagluense TaxID=360422 RepID=UPI001CF3B925|nr:hypothetical protein [Clostridium tagluense]MCB2300909.1 hypothetical protein [Clostridium tagluense]
MLESIASRSAQWYYYSTLANSGVGNKIISLSHAKTAVQIFVLQKYSVVANNYRINEE